MKKFLLLLGFVISLTSLAQTSADAAVQITASVQPSQIVLSWPAYTLSSQYQVFRKLKSAQSWGTAVAALPGSATSYTDASVTAGVNYEYRIQRTVSLNNYYGYINSGINVPAIEYRGRLILVVDSTFSSSLSTEIKRLITDIEGDGWEVFRHDVLRSASVTHVKDVIVNEYRNDSLPTTAVFLLGHVPVPYSGFINPDGHPDHFGAWPADVYYGDVNGTWTDTQGPATSTASPARTKNVPGDGKFDQSIVPGVIELQVGRVDLSRMSNFSSSELQLMKDYLDKDHNYRKKIYVPQKRAVIDDNFGYFSGEAFAASGYKNFAPLVGYNNITAADYFTTMTGNSYQWSYGCGGGYYNSASGVGTTANFAASNLDGVFTLLFGSYFGDWDTTNSFLRAPLAQGKMLTCIWSGRPHYQLHHMGLGENIGYGVLLTENNVNGLYYGSPTNITGRWVHNALMGDPTLRNDIVAPAANVVATRNGYNCTINWSASTETALAGYNIYRKNDSLKTYVRCNASPVTGTSFTDSCLIYAGIYTYMVRTVKLENTPSGTYYNMSEGITDTALSVQNLNSLANFTYAISGNTVTFTRTNPITATCFWDFGNGAVSTLQNPVVTYTANSSYFVYLIAKHPCIEDTVWAAVEIDQVGLPTLQAARLSASPVPSANEVTLIGIQPGSAIRIVSQDGKVVYNGTLPENNKIEMKDWSRGIYYISQSGKAGTLRVIKE